MSHAQQLHNRRYLDGSMQIINRTGFPDNSNNSPPPLMDTRTPFGYIAPRSKGISVLQMYIEFLH